MIKREQVTWVRWDDRRMREVISHPWLWVWTDSEGTERYFNTKAEAEAAKAEHEKL